MPPSRSQIAKAVLEVLQSSVRPLKAQEILEQIQQRPGFGHLERREVNSVLYREVSGTVQKDNNHNWTCSHIASRQAETADHITEPKQEDAQEHGLKCPKCGADMKLRTARRGPNPGQQFYGCTNYPKCKGTLNLEGSDTSAGDATSETSADPVERIDLSQMPRRVSIDVALANRQQMLIEASAAPRSSVRHLSATTLSSSYLRALAQWKLDLPIFSSDSGNTAPALWVHAAEKILKRGRISPLNDGLLEQLCKLTSFEHPDSLDEETWSNAVTRAAIVDSEQTCNHNLYGSDEEEAFGEVLLPAQGSHLKRWLARQVSLGGLTGNSSDQRAGQRIDFLIAHPDGTTIAIEIDGAQHREHQDADSSRDAKLARAGIDSIRVSATEVREGIGRTLDRLWDKIDHIPTISFVDLTPVEKLLVLCKRGHQIQIALVYALVMRLVDSHRESPVHITVRLDNIPNQSGLFARLVIDDLNELIADLVAIYMPDKPPLSFSVVDNIEESDWVVDFVGEDDARTGNWIGIDDCYVPVALSNTINAPATSGHRLTPNKIVCERVLRRIFGFDAFREGQFEAVERVLKGEDVIVLLPTGSGKSAAFQLAALLMPGTCIVIDPILSLIEDQIENLRASGVDRITQITSVFSGEERRQYTDLFAQGEYIFCYIAPERLQDVRFRESLQALTMHMPVSLVAIDEAHCVSEWGHDFRPAYLNIARTCREYCKSGGAVPPIMALTATASRSVLKDVQRELDIQEYDAIITPSSFDRPELYFEAIACRSDDKSARLQGLMQALPGKFGQTHDTFFRSNNEWTMSGLVFCPHVNGKFGVANISNDLGRSLGINVSLYSGSQPRNHVQDNWAETRRGNARAFKKNQSVLMACTKAFGMGIDKPNIRYTLHYCLPSSIESFYQEAGRAGRDKGYAFCSLLFSDDNPARTERLLDPNVSIEKVKEIADSQSPRDQDDITRALWFHTNSYNGQKIDYNHIRDVLDLLGPIDSARQAMLVYRTDSDKLQKEKAIHRLLTIGVIEDYTIDHSASEFSIRISHPSNKQVLESLYRYIAAYNRERAQVAIKQLCDELPSDPPYDRLIRGAGYFLIVFIYEVVERSRRQALYEILAACEDDPTDQGLRGRILNYLGSSTFTEDIDQLIDEENGGLVRGLEVVNAIQSSIEASQVRGESGRALEAYPDHPGLRLLRGISEAICVDPDESVIVENIRACVSFATDEYGIKIEIVIDVMVQAARMLYDMRPELARVIVRTLLEVSIDRRLVARNLISVFYDQEDLVELAVACLVNSINESLDSINWS